MVQAGPKHHKACNILGGREAYLSFYVGECQRFQKYWWWANQMTHFKEEWGKKTIGASIHH
jgi:hypothetical protein